MAKLIVKLNNDVVDHIEINQGDMKIGRKPGCEVVIDNLAVSGEHANIFTIGEDSFIQDLNSTNGTFINNKRIAKHHLRNGDAITIGKHTLIYMTDTASQQPVSDDFAKTVIINPTSREAPPPPAASPRPAPVASAPQHASLFILSGANSGKRIDITRPVTNLGKTGRRAGTITRRDEGFVLMPGEDEAAPRLNGKPVARDGASLRSGDIIEVAGTRLQFYLK